MPSRAPQPRGSVFNTPPVKTCTDADYQLQAGLCKAMAGMAPHNALGAAFAYLLLAAELQPDLLRTLLNERVVRYGTAGESMLSVLSRVARS